MIHHATVIVLLAPSVVAVAVVLAGSWGQA